MATRNVVLTDHHEQVIADLVASGRYQNASEVLREGVRLIEQREAREAAKLAALREAARIGFAAIDDSRYEDVPSDRVADYIAALGDEAARQARG